MNTLAGQKIVVLMGGPGSERDVSLATARGVSKTLRTLGAEVVEMDVRDENFTLPADVDLAFLTIHGTFGEDGQLQRILEQRGVAYTGDGAKGSEIAFDKIRSKEKFSEHGVTTPPWQVVTLGQRPSIPIPLVIKPSRQGSTVGVYIVKNAREIDAAATVLEVNTIPGMTEASLLPETAAAAGIDYAGLCLRIIQLSRARMGGRAW